jgi:hypothetical protein
LTGNPTTTSYTVNITWECPASKSVSVLGLLPLKSYNFVNLLNDTPATVWNDGLASALTVENFLTQGFEVSNIQVTNSHWINNNGHTCLVFNLKLTSDPVSAGDMVIAITGMGAIIAGIIVGLLSSTIVGAAVAVGLLVAGAFTILSVAVDILSSSPLGNVAGIVILIIVLIAALAFFGLLPKGNKKKKG